MPQPTYSLRFSDNGTYAENTDTQPISSMQKARDIAFDLSMETRAEIQIFEAFGDYENLVETVFA